MDSVVGRIIRDARGQVRVGAAAVDALIAFPEATAGACEDLGARIVGHLAGGAQFARAQPGGELNPVHDLERHRADEIIARHALQPLVVPVEGRHFAGRRILFNARLRRMQR